MSSLRCYYHHSGEESLNLIELGATESHHLVKVRRARIGDTVTAFDGRGNEWECLLEVDRAKAVGLKVFRHRLIPPPPYSITLAQGLPKGKTMDIIVQKAVELGAKQIVPLSTGYSNVRMNKDRAAQKVEKWHTIAIEACKQSGNSYLSEILNIDSLGSYCESLSPKTMKCIASFSAQAVSFRQAISNLEYEKDSTHRSAIILIGPEGDFTPAEHDLACKNGFIPITLGERVLRSDTAAIVALALLAYELREVKFSK